MAAEHRFTIPRKYAGVVMGALMSLIMNFIVSAIITYINLGLVDDFAHRWLLAFISVLPIALPVAIIVTPLVKSFVERISR